MDRVIFVYGSAEMFIHFDLVIITGDFNLHALCQQKLLI